MGKVNQQELARALKLSQTTVSRSLANHPAINAETKALVLETAAKLGYSQRIKRSAASSLEQRQTVWGVLISMPGQTGGQTETFQQVLKGIADKSTLHDSILDVVYHDPATLEASQVLRRVRSARWKGVILIYPVAREIVHSLAHQVACISIVENYQHDLIDSIDVDQSEGIISLVRRLSDFGHRRIAFMSWSYTVPTPWVMHRLGSYVEALYQCGLEFDPDRVINVRPGQKATPQECTEQVIEQIRKGVTAVVCPADHQAYALMRDLEARGIQVPADVSITGFDGIPPGFSKQIATIKVPYEELGRSAVHQLLRRLEQPSAPRRHILVDGNLLEGETIAHPGS